MYVFYGCGLPMERQEDGYRGLRQNYLSSKGFLGKMHGEIPDMLKLAIDYKAKMAFSMSLQRKPIFGVPIEFNEFTGRLIVLIGARNRNYSYVSSFLIKHVKEFQFSKEIYEEYKKLES